MEFKLTAKKGIGFLLRDVIDVYNADHNLFQMINSEKFAIQGDYDFDSTMNYYYLLDFYFVKPQYPIETGYLI